VPTTRTKPAQAATFAYLDPRILAANPANIRTDLGDLGPLTSSVRANGILEPLIVVPNGDDGYLIVDGHRRNSAAQEAEEALVPCLIRPDLDSAQATQQLVAMLVANTHREAISATDEARAYEQLRLGGLSAATIARRVGHKPAHVKEALRVAGSELATAAADRYQLSLPQAAALADFEADPDAVKRLVVTAKQRPDQWDHVVSQLREDRKAAAAYDHAVQELTAAGVTVLEHRPGYGEAAKALDHLVDESGEVLDADKHAACSGHAAVVERHEPTNVTWYCTDPAGNGHQPRFPSTATRPASVVDGKMTDEAKAERASVIANNKSWRAATPVRQAFVTDLLTRAKANKGVLRFAISEVVAEPEAVGHGRDETVARLLGQPQRSGRRRSAGVDAAARANDQRLPLVLLAQVAADIEDTMNEFTWRSPQPRAARWFTFLGACGYALADIERKVIDDAELVASPGEPDTSGATAGPRTRDSQAAPEAQEAPTSEESGEARIVAFPPPADDLEQHPPAC